MLNVIKKICQDLRDADEHLLADKVLCAFSALTKTKEPCVDLTYSYVMRELRREHPNKVKQFQIVFKDTFEEALDAGEESPEELAMLAGLRAIKEEINAR